MGKLCFVAKGGCFGPDRNQTAACHGTEFPRKWVRHEAPSFVTRKKVRVVFRRSHPSIYEFDWR
jgi:hypothetical protein